MTDINLNLSSSELVGVVEFVREFLAAKVDVFGSNIIAQSQHLMDSSRPAGVVYRRGAVLSIKSKALMALGLKQRGKGKVVSGSRFHRASAPGQPPARDTSTLYQSETYRATNFGGILKVNAPYSADLEFGTSRMKARPFLVPAIDLAAKETFG